MPGSHPIGSPGPMAWSIDGSGPRRKQNHNSWEVKVASLLREYISPLQANDLIVQQTPGQDDVALSLLSKSLEQRRYKPNEALFLADSPSDFFLLIVDGLATSPAKSGDEPSAQRSVGKFTFSPGSLLGEVDFHLDRSRSHSAHAGPRGCLAAAITRLTVAKLEEEEPKLALLIQRVALRSVCCMYSHATMGLFAR